MVVFVFTGAGGISCFIVEKDFKGLSFGANEKKVLLSLSLSL